MQEEFFIRHLTEKQVLGPILRVLSQTIPRDNLLSSASLELFEYIKKENIKDLVKHLVENYRDQLVSLSHLSTFRDLILRYDQTQGYTANMDYFLETDDEVARKPPPNARMMENIAVDPAEEEYWNTSDPEDDDDQAADEASATNGSSTPSRPLVDYPSDEEGDENAEPNPEEAEANEEAHDEEDYEASQPSVPPSVAPPERLAEKRRRQEDEEDELDKLMQNKRRNSSSSASNSAVSPGLRRRKSFAAGSGNGAGKKIAISLSPALKTGGSDCANEES